MVSAFALGIAAVVPRAAWAHPGGAIEPHELLTSWSPEPGVLLAIGVSAVLYARGVRLLWTRAGEGRGISRWRFYCFSAGLATLFVALVSPLDALGGSLFSAHMFQHELLMLVAAPLLVLGLPLLAFVWALPMRWRRRIGRFGKLPAVHGSVRGLTNPVTAWVLYAAALWTWHIPSLYQATLRSEAAHIAQHTSFLAASVLFWWVILHPARFRRREYGTCVIYIFTTAVHGSLLGALLTFSSTPWYPAYEATAPAWGLSPLADQQLGGLLMWVPPGFVYLTAALATLALWLRGMETRRRPAAADRIIQQHGADGYTSPA